MRDRVSATRVGRARQALQDSGEAGHSEHQRTMGSNRSSRLKEGTLEEEEDGAGSCFPKDGMKYLRLFYGLLMGFRLESIVSNQYTYEWS